jgi:glycosyltransferase involved in cell wall biosynthesis
LPYAVWCLGSDIHTYARLPILRKIIRDVLVGSARVFCDGYGLGEQAQALAGCECHFLPSLRRVTRLSRSEAVPRENLFVCPGRVERSKGVFDLLEAFGAIASDFPDWSLAYIGDGRARKKLEKLIETSGLGRQVKSLGFLPSDGMFRSIESARAVVIPTRSDSLPLTFGEAMQLKRPVIVTDVGDLRRFTERYHVGVVVPPASPAQLAAALRRFIEENRDYGNGFDECVRELDVDVAAERFLAWLADTGVDRVVPAAGVMC